MSGPGEFTMRQWLGLAMYRACNAARSGYKPGVGSRKPSRNHAGPLWICSCCGASIKIRHPGTSGLAQMRARRARVANRHRKADG